MESFWKCVSVFVRDEAQALWNGAEDLHLHSLPTANQLPRVSAKHKQANWINVKKRIGAQSSVIVNQE